MQQIVFLHGFLGAGINWIRVEQQILPELKPASRILSPDILWHGKNLNERRYQKALSQNDFHQQMVEDLEEKIQEPAIFVAHSFGIRPALLLWKKRPELVSALLVEDSAPVLSKVGYELLSSILDQTPVPFESRAQAKEYFEGKFPQEPSLARFLLSNLRKNEDGLQTWRFHKDALRALLEESRSLDLWDCWQSFDRPLSLLLGGQSQTVPPQTLEKMKALRSKKLDVRQIEESGHWVHVDAFEKFCKVVLEFCEAQAQA